MRGECLIDAAVRADHEPFRCDVDPHRETVHVRPVGELDLATVPLLETHLDELHAAGFKHLTLDLRRVSFLDSSAMRLIVVCDANGSWRRIAALLRFARIATLRRSSR